MKPRDGNESEHVGLRLLKKGRRGLLRALFSRAGLITLLMLLQVALLVVGYGYLQD